MCCVTFPISLGVGVKLSGGVFVCAHGCGACVGIREHCMESALSFHLHEGSGDHAQGPGFKASTFPHRTILLAEG